MYTVTAWSWVTWIKVKKPQKYSVRLTQYTVKWTSSHHFIKRTSSIKRPVLEFFKKSLLNVRYERKNEGLNHFGKRTARTLFYFLNYICLLYIKIFRLVSNSSNHPLGQVTSNFTTKVYTNSSLCSKVSD